MVRSSEISDSEIMQLIRDDPDQGFTQLLRLYGGRVQGYLCRRFPSLDESGRSDAVTDAMLALVDTFDDQRGSLPSWFLLLAHQHAVGALRSRKPFLAADAQPTELDEVDRGGDLLDEMVTLERVREVHQVIRTLPVLERAVLEADLAEGHTVAAHALAEAFETTVGSIYAARKRARTKLIDKCGWVRDRLRVKTQKCRNDSHEQP